MRVAHPEAFSQFAKDAGGASIMRSAFSAPGRPAVKNPIKAQPLAVEAKTLVRYVKSSEMNPALGIRRL